MNISNYMESVAAVSDMKDKVGGLSGDKKALEILNKAFTTSMVLTGIGVPIIKFAKDKVLGVAKTALSKAESVKETVSDLSSRADTAVEDAQETLRGDLPSADLDGDSYEMTTFSMEEAEMPDEFSPEMMPEGAGGRVALSAEEGTTAFADDAAAVPGTEADLATGLETGEEATTGTLAELTADSTVLDETPIGAIATAVLGVATLFTDLGSLFKHHPHPVLVQAGAQVGA